LKSEFVVVIGILVSLCGFGLAFAKTDTEALRKKSHSNPGLALYRFQSWRYGVAVVAVVSGFIIIAESLLDFYMRLTYNKSFKFVRSPDAASRAA
jgi:hypothetical protein